MSAGIAARYATALFELAREENTLPAVEQDVLSLNGALNENPILQDLIGSPLYSRQDQTNAIMAVAARMGLSPFMISTLGLMAEKRRLFVLPHLLDRMEQLIAHHRNELTAEVVSAAPLTEAQMGRLEQTLRDAAGQTVKIRTSVDESLIGGLVVRLGSLMVDNTIASRLARLQNAMKEVG